MMDSETVTALKDDVLDEISLEVGLCRSLVDLLNSAGDDLEKRIVCGTAHIISEKLGRIDELLNPPKETA